MFLDIVNRHRGTTKETPDGGVLQTTPRLSRLPSGNEASESCTAQVCMAYLIFGESILVHVEWRARNTYFLIGRVPVGMLS